MPWWGWTLASLAYAIGFRFTLRWWMEALGGIDDWVDVFFMVWIAATTTVVVTVLVALCRSFNCATGGMSPDTLIRLMAGESRHQKRQRREAELRKREEQIQKTERELGIVS